jgi:transporter family protein
VWAIVAKWIGDGLSAAHSQALSTVGLLPVLAILCARRPIRGDRLAAGLLLAGAAGILTCIGNAAYYDVLHRGYKAVTVVPLTALYPMVTVVLALLFLKERMNRVQTAGVVGSLGAIYLFNVRGEGSMTASAMVWVLAPILLWGVAGLLQKLSTNRIPGEAATLAFLAAFIPVAVAILWREPAPREISSRTWLAVCALGLCFAAGNFALLAAFATGGKASIVAPIAGLYPLVSVPMAVLLFGERVGIREGLGIVLALGSVVALAWETPRRAAPPVASLAPEDVPG